MSLPIPKKIIKVEPIQKFFRINWRFDLRCNYDCSYCSEEWHDVNGKIKTLDELKSDWQRIFALAKPKNLPLQLLFFGGEPTANRNFQPFVDWLYDNYSDYFGLVGFTSNGSAPLRIYKKLIDRFDFISFSVHSEFFDEKKFFEKVIAVKEHIGPESKKRINVSIMDEPWNRHRFSLYKDILIKHNIDWKISQIDWTPAIRTIPIVNRKPNLIS